MTLDRLLHALEYHNEISSDERYAIIAALRRLERLEKAGQALSAAAQKVLDVDRYGAQHLTRLVYERRLREAAQAWDAAVGEKE